MLSSVRSLILVALATGVSTTASAALPQSGLWAFDGESNGKPGRGFQIDRQDGNRIIVSYFGYRSDGSSMFLQAAGSIGDDGKTFSAELNEYKNGRAMGGDARTGELAQMMGTVLMEFDTSSTGAITLPSEAKRPISRIAFNEHRTRLNNDFNLTRVVFDKAFSWTFQDSASFALNGDGLNFKIVRFSGTETCSFEGDLSASGDAFVSKGSYHCVAMAPGYYRLEELKVDQFGFLSAMLHISTDANMSYFNSQKLFGTCIGPLGAVILGVPNQNPICTTTELEEAP
ncbi:hypothetical protein G7048_07970 [Diaphorobacter sp. HDW4B]|uniref:hypothetical protein n=1 Tax=Diaphorobacter sp. HDW4B TaxID=2714925 RepID=UPI0014078BE2|nr:hypothetical protein [Diaphorobacter sp. HDW4B]QIL70295.1 hypothetical protein G7048_07970 [Diaphorobacter sp. HDW4B]